MTSPSPTPTNFNEDLKHYKRSGIIISIGIILFFILLYALPYSSSTNKGLALLAFIAILWLTEAVHVTITALAVPVLAVLLGLVTTKASLAAFSSPIIFLFFGGFALATALHIQGLDRVIANRIMALAKGKLLLAAIYLFLATAFLSMWMSNTATAAMMLPLALGVLSKMDEKTEHNTFLFILLGIAYSASIGGMGTLIGSPPNAIVAAQFPNFSFSDWLPYGLPIMIIMMPIMIGALYITFKPNLNHTFEYKFEKDVLNTKQYITLAIFVFIALCWIFSGFLNPIVASILGLKGKISGFDSIIALLAPILICLTRVAQWSQIQKNTDWGVLMLFGGGITLSTVLKNSGASQVLADLVIEFVKGGHFFIIGLVVATFIIFLTEFTSNTASAALLVPIFISIADSLGMPAIGLAMIIGIGASCAFMLPVATPPNAIVFGTGQIKQSEMIKVGVRLNVVSIFVIAIIGYLFWF